MNIAPHVVDVAHVIQLAVAPVFLLSGVGVMLTVFTNRLGRIIDRARILEERLHIAEINAKSEIYAQLTLLSRRALWTERAIGCATVTGLLICVVIVTLFVSDVVTIDLSGWIALMFALAMLAFIGAFVSFLREIVLATVRIRTGPSK
jgi:hypothetical protein